MRYQGKISEWNGNQGFGFITPNGGNEKVFIHLKAFSQRTKRPSAGDVVTYNLTYDERGRSRASNVKFVGEQARVSDSPPSGWWGSAVLAALFCIFLATAIVLGHLPIAIAYLYIGASVIAFVLYALDKSAAQKNQWRTRESTLHVVGLIGGWPGALLAQKMFRHKSRKKEFQIVFWATVVMNCLLLGWLSTHDGVLFIESMGRL